MGRRTLLISALVFLLLLVITLKLTRSRSAEPESPFFALGRSLPDTLFVAYGPDTTVLVPRTSGAGWDLVRPVRDAADVVAVNALLKRLERLPVESRRFPLTPQKMDTYGMRFPRAMLRVAYRGGLSPDTLLVGAFTPSGEFDYVRHGSGAEVALLESRQTRTYLLKSTLDLRDRVLLPFADFRAVNVRWMGPGGTVRAEAARDADGAWRVRRPFPGPVDPERFREYLLSLNHMHIDRFGPEREWLPAAYGLASSAVAVTVVTADGDTIRAALGDHVPGDSTLCYAFSSVRTQLLEVPMKYRNVLLGSVDPLRERAPFGFGLDRVDSVGVQYGSNSVTIVPTDAASANRGAREAITNWVRLRAERFEAADTSALGHRGLSRAEGHLVWFGAGDTLAVVDVGGEVEGWRALRVSGGRAARPGEILLLRPAAVEPLWAVLCAHARGEAGAP